jgi:hypothetical protein
MTDRTPCVVAWTAATVLSTTMCFARAQTMPATSPAATRTGEEPGASSTAEAREGDPLVIFHAPLLREGSALVEARSRLVADETAGGWKLLLEQSKPGEPAHDLVLLPCTTLSEMRRFVESAPDQTIIFQVTGDIFVYRGRNYVLPTHAPVITQEEKKPPAASAPASGEAPVAAEPQPHPSVRDSAQDIARRLEAASGSLARSATTASRPNEKSASASATRPGAKSSNGNRATGRNSAGGGAVGGDPVLRENTAIMSRRGKLKRDIAGGWLFVFDADASGLNDPPVKLLPCQLLERIEDYARKMGNNSPALLSGQVYLYEGRNYLLPTLFRIPQDRRNLTP